MALGGPQMWCPHCKEITKCKAKPLYQYGKPKARNWKMTAHEDIAWFRRIRHCQKCNESFSSAETGEALLEELLELRKRIAVRNMKCAKSVRRLAPWLKGKDAVPRELAVGLIQSSAWWLTHSSGSPVRAPGHAANLYESKAGWIVAFGANTFLVGLALQRSRIEINRYLDIASGGRLPLLSDLKVAVRKAIRGAVANYEGSLYESLYPETDGEMKFGAQAIDLNDAVDYVLTKAQVGDLFA